MTTLSSANPTLLDLARQTDPNGGIADIVEMMTAINEVLLDMSWVEGNLKTGNKTTIRTGLPEPTWRKLYGGVQPTKGTTIQVTDTCGMLEAYAEQDVALVKLAKDPKKFRLNEDRAHIEGMSIALASTLFYGNTDDTPEKFMGLTPRYNSLSAENADNIIDAGGAGADNTSIWLVVWGDRTCHGIIPQGSKAGIQTNDKGQVTIENVDGSGGRMEAFRTHYKQDAGLTLRDWRYVVRTANIDLSDLDTLANTKNILTLMIQMTERIPSLGMGRPVFYMNRTMREKLRLGILEKIGNNLSWENVSGKRVMMFDEIPVRRCDALVNDETLVS